MTTTLDDVLDAHRRDLRAVREDLLEAQEKSAQQTLDAHLQVLRLQGEAELIAKGFRGEVRDRFVALETRLDGLELGQRQILTLLERAVEIPASPGWFGRVVERVGAALALRPASARLLVAVVLTATLVSGLSSLLSACTVAGALHTRAPAALDPTPLGGLYP